MADANPSKRQALQKKILAVLLLVLGLFGGRAALEYHSYRSAKALFDEANVLISEGDWEGADAKLTLCVAGYKYMPAAWEELSTTKDILGRHDEMVAVLKEATTYLPDSPRMNLLYAIALMKNGQREECLAVARKVQAIDPGEPQSRSILRSPDKLIAYYKEKQETRSTTPLPATAVSHSHSH